MPQENRQLWKTQTFLLIICEQTNRDDSSSPKSDQQFLCHKRPQPDTFSHYMVTTAALDALLPLEMGVGNGWFHSSKPMQESRICKAQ